MKNLTKLLMLGLLLIPFAAVIHMNAVFAVVGVAIAATRFRDTLRL